MGQGNDHVVHNRLYPADFQLCQVQGKRSSAGKGCIQVQRRLQAQRAGSGQEPVFLGYAGSVDGYLRSCTLVGTDLPYYCKYIFGNETWMYSSLYLAENITLICGAMICPLLLKRFNKRDLSLAGCILAVVGQALFLFNRRATAGHSLSPSFAASVRLRLPLWYSV